MSEEEREDLRRQPFNERLVEIARNKRDDIFHVLYGEKSKSESLPLICVQFTPKQKPKISYGFALYNVGTKSWFVMEPKTSIEMRSIIRGLYSPTSLPFMLDQLFDDELRTLSETTPETDFEALFKKYYGALWRDSHHYKLALSSWEKSGPQIRELATVLINRRQNPHTGGVCQRGFPKGRPMDDEAPLLTAMRELLEETNIKIVFENSQVIKNLSRGIKPHQNLVPGEIIHRQAFWEDCHIDFPDGFEDYTPGYVCRDIVNHIHADISGRVYKTVLWVCVVNLPENPDVQINPLNHETRAGLWVGEEELLATSRVVDLARKCEICINRNFPHLIT